MQVDFVFKFSNFQIFKFSNYITMNQPKIISEGPNYRAINVGNFSDLNQYAYDHPVRKVIVEGKVFTGELLQSTGAELSFMILPPHAEMPFLHAHKRHEEIYVIIRGSGQFQVDNDVFDIKEGSVIRINPSGSRVYRNNSDNPMVFMCIQSMADSIDCFFGKDGLKAEGIPAWEK
jgi:mannose-6-phosphate isomerase-like protein (cupin superfamily)